MDRRTFLQGMAAVVGGTLLPHPDKAFEILKIPGDAAVFSYSELADPTEGSWLYWAGGIYPITGATLHCHFDAEEIHRLPDPVVDRARRIIGADLGISLKLVPDGEPHYPAMPSQSNACAICMETADGDVTLIFGAPEPVEVDGEFVDIRQSDEHAVVSFDLQEHEITFRKYTSAEFARKVMPQHLAELEAENS